MASTRKATGLITNKGIELLTWSTPNCFRVSTLLEELKEAYGKDYTVQGVNLFAREQKEPWFTSINPNGRAPAIVDHDKGGHVVFESTAILNYLVRHYDPEFKFSFEDPLEASEAEQWLFWMHSGLGVIQAQANKFYRMDPERHPFPTQHYVGELERLFGVLDTRLSNRDYIVGPGRGRYSTVDMSAWPLINAIAAAGIELESFPNVYAFWERLENRPGIVRGGLVPSGKPFVFGYRAVQKMKEEDPEGFEKREAPLREVLAKAREQYGYVYRSP